MASLRQLPSGRWQASVLLDNASRTTSTFDTQAQATTWALETEQARDEVRAQKRALDADRRAAALLASLQELADQGQFSKQDKAKLAVIVQTVK